jgi:quinol monooxygenase YgiN
VNEVIPAATVEPAVHVTLAFRTQPGMDDAFAEALVPLMAEVRREPHFLGISVLRDQADPDHFMFVERWADKDYYLGAHDVTPHLIAFKETALPLLAGPPEVVIWDREIEVATP